MQDVPEGHASRSLENTEDTRRDHTCVGDSMSLLAFYAPMAKKAADAATSASLTHSAVDL